jgi:cyclophilin family peptidyl-prolyl cis-trans isomerase/protein-disulfide isomerase
MRKYWLFIVLLAVVILSACGTKATPAPDTAATASIPEGPAMDCTVFSLFPDPKDPASVNLPAISDKDWSRGPKGAMLTLVVYSDFQCPYCSVAGRQLKEFETTHADQVRVIYRHFPLNIHDKALITAQAAEAAGLQGKFWEMHDFLFVEANWQVWTSQTPADFENWIVDQAKSIGLDADRFSKDLTSAAIVDKVQKAYTQALDTGLTSTPSLYVFINGELIFVPSDQLPYDSSTLQAIIDLTQLSEKQYTQCPPTIIDQSKSYTAKIKTNVGSFTVKLFTDKAPLAVNNFVFLAKQGFYDGVTFHRVLADFVAQTGDPSGTGFGGPGYQFKNEVSDDLKFDRAGLLGMANSGPDTNGSQFFITYKEVPQLDGGYTIFGEVTEGMDVVKKLTLRDPASAPSSELPKGDQILSITIEEK